MKPESHLPNWVLSNLVVVEDRYLAPKEKAAEAIPADTTISPKVLAKWKEFCVRHGLPQNTDLVVYLTAAKREPLSRQLTHAFSLILKVKLTQTIELKFAWLNANTSLWFILADNTLVEFVTFRGLRTLKAKAMHIAKQSYAGMPEPVRLENIGKQSFRRQIQGGRLNQERRPRDRWSKTRTTF